MSLFINDFYKTLVPGCGDRVEYRSNRTVGNFRGSSFLQNFLRIRVSPFTGLEEWTGLLDWNTGLYFSAIIELIIVNHAHFN